MATERTERAWQAYLATCQEYGIRPNGLSPDDIDDELADEEAEEEDEDENE